jgi:hypothetical protein
MKSYTDLEQSKKLAEILPIESADMGWYYSRNPQAARNQMWVGTKAENADIPCWSLAALLSVIKPINENTYTIRGTLDGGATISFDEITNVMCQEEEIIDAVFEMVVWLKEIGK